VLRYTGAFFKRIPLFNGLVENETANGFELTNEVDCAIATNSYRSSRGRPIQCAVFDEVAFWKDESTATPDEEVYRAIRPGMATLPDAMLVGISTPYSRRGLLFGKFRDHFGKSTPDVLVIKAPTRALNPTIPQEVVDAAIADDPAAARAEWLGEFRDDVETFVSPQVVEACTVCGRHELPRVNGVSYIGFCDPSGGSADSMTLGIAHKQDDGAVLDAVREVRPPFSPKQVVFEFAGFLKGYGISKISGDRYAGEWPREAFREHGIEYIPSEQTKSEIYIELLPTLNSHRVELLDIPRLNAQLCGLERRTARSGKDSIDHAPGGHDDIVNAAAGALVAALTEAPAFVITPELLARTMLMPRRRQHGRFGQFAAPNLNFKMNSNSIGRG
jgi:hypothetical protein